MIEIIILFAGFLVVMCAAILTFKNKISYFKGVCFAVAGQLTAFMLNVAVGVARHGVSPIDMAIDTAFANLNGTIRALAEQQVITETVKADALNMVMLLKDACTILFPAILIIVNIAAVLIMFMIFKAVLKLFKKDVSFIPAFCEIRLTKGIFMGGVFTTFMGYILLGKLVGDVFLNIQLLFMAYMALSGMSLIDFLLSKKIKNGFLRFVIYMAAFVLTGRFFGIIIYISILGAIVDSVLDFRGTKKNSEGK